MVRAHRISATTDVVRAGEESDIIFICVQTPSLPSGRIDVRPVKSACRNVGRALARSGGYKVVVVKSTVVPSTTDTVVKPILEEASGKICCRDFGLCMNPEFLQEGSALRDSLEPARVVIGSCDKRAGDVCKAVQRDLGMSQFLQVID